MWLRVDRKYKAKSHNDMVGVLALIYDEILENIDNLKTVNPFRQIKRMKGRATPYEPHPKPLREHIARTMPAEDTQLWIAVQLLYYHFIRIRELGRVRLYDIDWRAGTIVIRDTVNLKAGRARVMVIRRSLLDYMLAHGYDQLPADSFLFGNRGEPGATAVSINYLSNKWRDYRTRHSIPEVYKLYAVKHTGNTAMAVSGIPAQLQMLHNGHGSLNTTQIYISRHTVDVEKLREVSEAMASF
jgi:integrase